jgi:hypothetical protein
VSCSNSSRTTFPGKIPADRRTLGHATLARFRQRMARASRVVPRCGQLAGHAPAPSRRPRVARRQPPPPRPPRRPPRPSFSAPVRRSRPRTSPSLRTSSASASPISSFTRTTPPSARATIASRRCIRRLPTKTACVGFARWRHRSPAGSSSWVSPTAIWSRRAAFFPPRRFTTSPSAALGANPPRRRSPSMTASPPATRMKLSIVIPCYNEAQNHPHHRRRVRAAPVADKEIIIVDDCSRDGTRDLLRTEIAPLVTASSTTRSTRARAPPCAPASPPPRATS